MGDIVYGETTSRRYEGDYLTGELEDPGGKLRRHLDRVNEASKTVSIDSGDLEKGEITKIIEAMKAMEGGSLLEKSLAN